MKSRERASSGEAKYRSTVFLPERTFFPIANPSLLISSDPSKVRNVGHPCPNISMLDETRRRRLSGERSAPPPPSAAGGVLILDSNPAVLSVPGGLAPAPSPSLASSAAPFACCCSPADAPAPIPRQARWGGGGAVYQKVRVAGLANTERQLRAGSAPTKMLSKVAQRVVVGLWWTS